MEVDHGVPHVEHGMDDLTNFDRASYEDGADHEAHILKRADGLGRMYLFSIYDMTFPRTVRMVVRKSRSGQSQSLFLE